MRNVLRSMPMYLRPYRVFSWITSKSVQSFSSGSLSRWKGRASFSRNFVMRLQQSRDTPRTCGAGPLEPVGEVAEFLRLDGAAGSRVLRIEIQHQRLAARIGQAEVRRPRWRRPEMRGPSRPSLTLGHDVPQFFTGSRIASRFCESQYSMKSSRSCATGSAGGHVDHHLHGEHGRAGLRGGVAARGDFGDLDVAGREETGQAGDDARRGPSRSRRWNRGCGPRAGRAARCAAAAARDPPASARRLSSDSRRATACQLPVTSSSMANSPPRGSMRLSLMLAPQSAMVRTRSWASPGRSLPMAEMARNCFMLPGYCHGESQV